MPSETRSGETAESIEQYFSSRDELSEDARALLQRVSSARAGLEENGVEPLIDALDALRARSRDVFDNIRHQVLCSADWWPPIWTELSSVSDPAARLVVQLQDLKYQVEEQFYDQLRSIHNCEGASAIVMFGNQATDDDMSWVNFRRFANLELLDLSENHLTTIPLGVERLPMLRYLSVAKNSRLRAGLSRARAWNTPQLEHLDVRRTTCDPEFIEVMSSKYPEAVILHD